MWHVLRAEIAYFRPWLIGAFGIAAGVSAIITVVFYFDDNPPDFVATGLRAMFLLMAPMIVGFIIQSYRQEERRARLLMAGPITPKQMAAVMITIPWILFGFGLVAVAVVTTVDTLITGRFSTQSLTMACFVGGQMFTYSFMGLVAQEASAARQQGRRRASNIGWAVFVSTIVVIALSYVILAMQVFTWVHVALAHVTVSLISMAFCTRLYANRTDFTR